MIEDTDHGYRRILREFRKLQKQPFVDVGIQRNAGKYDTGVPVVVVAATHEFGSPSKNIPQRSYIRSTVDENIQEIDQFIDHLYGEILRGRLNVERALGLIGVKVKALIQKKITDIDTPPLKETTIKRKLAKNRSAEAEGGRIAETGNPLIDSGLLRASINFLVKMRGGSK